MNRARRSGDLEVVILAAGESRRFNGVKLLAEFDHRPLLQRAIDSARTLSDVTVTVVVGAHRATLNQHIDFAGVKRLYNAHWREGMASSLRCAVACAEDTTQAMLFVAADQALVRGDHLAEMVKHWRDSPERIVAAYYQGEAGVPALIPRRFWPGLALLKGDSGAKKIINGNKLYLTLYNLPEAEWDVDTPQDLMRLVSAQIGRNSAGSSAD